MKNLFDIENDALSHHKDFIDNLPPIPRQVKKPEKKGLFGSRSYLTANCSLSQSTNDYLALYHIQGGFDENTPDVLILKLPIKVSETVYFEYLQRKNDFEDVGAKFVKLFRSDFTTFEVVTVSYFENDAADEWKTLGRLDGGSYLAVGEELLKRNFQDANGFFRAFEQLRFSFSREIFNLSESDKFTTFLAFTTDCTQERYDAFINAAKKYIS